MRKAIVLLGLLGALTSVSCTSWPKAHLLGGTYYWVPVPLGSHGGITETGVKVQSAPAPATPTP